MVHTVRGIPRPVRKFSGIVYFPYPTTLDQARSFIKERSMFCFVTEARGLFGDILLAAGRVLRQESSI